jgi:hypothetical protein
MVFVDDSGVYLLLGLVRTYTLCGQTSVLRSVYAHGHLSVMSGITMDGGLYTPMRDEAPDSLDSVVFLSPLLPHVAEQLLLSSAGSPIHKEQVRTFLAGGGANQMHVEQLPAYAPDLSHVKGSGTTGRTWQCGICVARTSRTFGVNWRLR